MPFDDIRTNYKNAWNNSTNSFSMVSTKGIYFVALSASPPPDVRADYGLDRNGIRYASISRSDPYGSYETIGREAVVPLAATEVLHVSSPYEVFSDDGGSAYTSLTMFSIYDTMQQFPVVFSVARRDFLAGHLDPMVFNIQLVNEGSHFDTSRQLFTAPTSGIYYFSMSVGLAGGLTAHVELQKNNQAFVNIIRNSTSHPGTDTMGRSIMMSLEEGDTVHLVNHENQVAWSSPSGLETSFSGLLYEPSHGHMVITSLSFTV